MNIILGRGVQGGILFDLIRKRYEDNFRKTGNKEDLGLENIILQDILK